MSESHKSEWVGFGAALVILLAVAAASHRGSNAGQAALASVKHTGEVQEQIVRMNADYAQSVSARRAFVVAGDGSQLADVPALDAKVRHALSGVRESISGNPSQQRRLDALARAMDERLRDLDGAVQHRQRTGTGGDGPGEIAWTTRVQALRDGFVLEEHRLRQERSCSG